MARCLFHSSVIFFFYSFSFRTVNNMRSAHKRIHHYIVHCVCFAFFFSITFVCFCFLFFYIFLLTHSLMSLFDAQLFHFAYILYYIDLIHLFFLFYRSRSFSYARFLYYLILALYLSFLNRVCILPRDSIS